MNQNVLLDIFFVVGTIAVIIAFVVYQIQQIKWLKHHGKRIVAMVTSIRQEMGRSRAGYPRDNYYVTAKWTNPRTGRTHTFWTWVMNSTPDYTNGSLVPVVIDPNNPNRYTMDL